MCIMEAVMLFQGHIRGHVCTLVSLLAWEGPPLQSDGGWVKQKDSVMTFSAKIPTREDSFIETDPRYTKFMGQTRSLGGENQIHPIK